MRALLLLVCAALGCRDDARSAPMAEKPVESQAVAAPAHVDLVRVIERLL